MNLARVIGTVWATQKDPHMTGLKMQIIQPLDHLGEKKGKPIVAADTVGAGPGEVVCYVTAREAVIPLKLRMAPVDAGIVGIIDRVDLGAAQEGKARW